MRQLGFLRLASPIVSSETIAQLRPWVRFSQLEQSLKPQEFSEAIVREFEEFSARREPLIQYIRKPEEVSLVGMYILRAYAMHGARKAKLARLVELILECRSPLYRNELWNTYLLCLCENADLLDSSQIKILHEQMDLYSIEPDGTTFTYFIALYLQCGMDPSPLYHEMATKNVTPSVRMFKSILPSLARSFPNNEILDEIFSFFLSDDACDSKAHISVQRTVLWMLWITKDSTLTPALLPMLFQLLVRQIEAMPNEEKKQLCATEKQEQNSSESGNTETHTEYTHSQVLQAIIKPQLMRHVERHCWWFRDISAFDGIAQLLPESYKKEIGLPKDPASMVRALFSKGFVERGMQCLVDSAWEFTTSDESGCEIRKPLPPDRIERHIETLAVELRTTSAADQAFYFLEDRHEKKLEVSVNALNLIILACNMQGEEIRAIETAEAIESFGLKANEITFKCLLRLHGPFQMRPNYVHIILEAMGAMQIPMSASVVHLAVVQLVWIDSVNVAVELVMQYLKTNCVLERTVMHLTRRLIYLGDMHAAAEIIALTLASNLKESFPKHFVRFAALRTQDPRLMIE